MYRIAAFSWNNKDSGKTAAAQRLTRLLLSTSPDWQCVLDLPGLRVFHTPQPAGTRHAYILMRNAGVILGKLFDCDLDGDHIPSDPTFNDKESNLIVESKGRRLVERYWGHYVAFLRTLDGEQRFILRDPTGALPCYLTKATGIDVILSDVADCVRLNLTPFSVNWDHVAAFFVHNRLITRTTGHKEVTQVYAGECVAIDGDAMTRTFYWNPADVCEADTIEKPAEARAALRSVVRRCVNAWASCYDSVVLELSGGLDSSIIAACLGEASTRTNTLCLHYYTEMAEGDERAYARTAALSAGCELIEYEKRASTKSLESQLIRSRVATPSLQGIRPASETFRQRLVTERHAGAVFSGKGGDHLFQQKRDKLIAAEYAHRHGLRPQLLSVVADTARLTEQSIWSVFGAAVRYGLLRRSFDPYADDHKAPSILSDDVRASLSPRAYEHPWVKNASRLPASKIQQVFHVVDCQPLYASPCPYAENIHPLISQPIIERCLQIPTYVLAHRGKSRGLFREAFEADVPAQIIHRFSKGGSTSYLNQMLVENAPFLREYLLDGVLVNEGVLNRRELERQLSERELIRGNEIAPILVAAKTESWLHNWADVRQRSAA